MYDDNYGHQIRTDLTQVIEDGLREINEIIEMKMEEVYENYSNLFALYEEE